MEKFCCGTFSPFQKTERKNTQKRSHLAGSTSTADGTRLIVTFGRVLL
jgi:hypothetical protein